MERDLSIVRRGPPREAAREKRERYSLRRGGASEKPAIGWPARDKDTASRVRAGSSGASEKPASSKCSTVQSNARLRARETCAWILSFIFPQEYVYSNHVPARTVRSATTKTIDHSRRSKHAPCTESVPTTSTRSIFRDDLRDDSSRVPRVTVLHLRECGCRSLPTD